MKEIVLAEELLSMLIPKSGRNVNADNNSDIEIINVIYNL